MDTILLTFLSTLCWIPCHRIWLVNADRHFLDLDCHLQVTWWHQEASCASASTDPRYDGQWTRFLPRPACYLKPPAGAAVHLAAVSCLTSCSCHHPADRGRTPAPDTAAEPSIVQCHGAMQNLGHPATIAQYHPPSIHILFSGYLISVCEAEDALTGGKRVDGSQNFIPIIFQSTKIKLFGLLSVLCFIYLLLKRAESL